MTRPLCAASEWDERRWRRGTPGQAHAPQPDASALSVLLVHLGKKEAMGEGGTCRIHMLLGVCVGGAPAYPGQRCCLPASQVEGVRRRAVFMMLYTCAVQACSCAC